MYSVHGTLEVALAPEYTAHNSSKQFPTFTYALPGTMPSYLTTMQACFDRIIPSLGLMATEHLGIPQQATASMLATIKGMHFFIRTAHGISLGLYTSTTNALILGVLQGRGAAQCIWISLSCILLQAHQSHTTGFQATCPHNTRTSQRPGKA